MNWHGMERWQALWNSDQMSLGAIIQAAVYNVIFEMWIRQKKVDSYITYTVLEFVLMVVRSFYRISANKEQIQNNAV